MLPTASFLIIGFFFYIILLRPQQREQKRRQELLNTLKKNDKVVNSGGIIGPDNQRVGSYAGGTNMAFGGEDGKLLLVVGNKNAHTLEMNVPGLP